MALILNTVKSKDGYVATEKLYITKDRTRLVAKTDPDVGFLYAGKGDVISQDEAERLGLVPGIPEVKESRPSETKEAKPKKKAPRSLGD